MSIPSYRTIFSLFTLFMAGVYTTAAQSTTNISGQIFLDSSWDRTIYISLIPTFDDMHYMSNKMIIGESHVDSLGYFSIDLDFLPSDEQLYRLHSVKKGNTPATLIIGGHDENHLFIVLRGSENIELRGNSLYAPFKNVSFNNSPENNALQLVSRLAYVADSIGSESTASKRKLIEDQLHLDLINVADTSQNLLVSLFALYNSKYESSYSSSMDFYKDFTKRHANNNNPYYSTFKKHLPSELTHTDKPESEPERPNYFLLISLGAVVSISAFFVGKYGITKNRNLKKLSIQERKVYELIIHGLSNKEIADELNIGLSTVKSHVSSVFSKLKVKSRKELHDKN